MNLATPVSEIHRIGERTSSKLKKIGIETVQDLIFYYPFRYDDLSKVKKISELQIGEIATIKAKIQLIKNWRSPRKKKMLTQALVEDDSGSLKAMWFNQPYLAKTLALGEEVYLAGLLSKKHGGLHLVSPQYEKVSSFVKEKGTSHTARIVPIYSVTLGLSQKQIRFLAKSILFLAREINDWLPEKIKNFYKLIDLDLALREVHFPDNNNILEKARRRLKFNELFLMQLQALFIKRQLAGATASKIVFREEETKEFVKSLPFKLTNAQRKAAWEIIKDLDKDKPMNRLLEGDVGSGKTIVAGLAVLNACLSGHQTVFMAPTELLAKQHYKTLNKFFGCDLKIALVVRTEAVFNGDSSITKKSLLGKIAKGEVNLVIGTHALIQEKVNFGKLALAIIDEQHRFGVAQRKELQEKAGNLMPHFLSMTATPIPRTLALSLYGDLDLSILDELPPGRKKVITKVIDSTKRQEAYTFVQGEINKGHQVFVICPLIDPSDKLGVKSVTEEYERLDKEIFPDLRIAYLHGKLKPQEKEKTMKEFLENKINILVATSVIEVGIDVPNASIMMIEGAERFGLAQLHQFRGRVGRSERQSHCFLFAESESERSQKRLEAMVACNDGFELAERDLEMRGPGEIYGKTQSGFADFKIATLFDYQIIKEANEAAKELLKEDAELKNYPLVAQRVGEMMQGVQLA